MISKKWSDADIGSELEEVLCFMERVLNSLCSFVSFYEFLLLFLEEIN